VDIPIDFVDNARLLLRVPEPADAAALMGIIWDPEVVEQKQVTLREPPGGLDLALKNTRDMIRQWQLRGNGQWSDRGTFRASRRGPCERRTLSRLCDRPPFFRPTAMSPGSRGWNGATSACVQIVVRNQPPIARPVVSAAALLEQQAPKRSQVVQRAARGAQLMAQLLQLVHDDIQRFDATAGGRASCRVDVLLHGVLGFAHHLGQHPDVLMSVFDAVERNPRFVGHGSLRRRKQSRSRAAARRRRQRPDAGMCGLDATKTPREEDFLRGGVEPSGVS
jgi:hypothetical protein